MKSSQRFILNALAMTGVALLMRAVSVGFNVYVSNKVGSEVMGLYSLIGGVYGFAITVACSGINLGAMRLVSDALGTSDHALIRSSMKKCILYCIIFGSLASAMLYFGAEFIGVHMLQEIRCIKSLKLLSLSLIPISLSSALNGYFTAVRRVYKNALTVISEEALRIFAVVLLLSVFVGNDVERACVALVAGGTIAEISSCLISSAFYFFDMRLHIARARSRSESSAKKLLSISLPVAFSAYARSGLLTLEHSLILPGLRKSGLDSSTALSRYGMLHGMALPVVLFPSAIVSSFSGLLVPEIAESRVRGEWKRIKYICEKVFSTALLFSIFISGIMLCFSYELGRLIYGNTQISTYIKLLAPLIPVMYIDTATDALLKGLGQQVYSMNVNIADSLLSVILVYILLPIFSTEGYIITIYLTELVNASLSILRLINISGIKVKLFRRIFIPIFCVSASTFGAKLVCMLLSGYIGSQIVEILLLIVLSLIFYLITLKAVGAVSTDDLKWLLGFTFGEKKATQARSEFSSSSFF